MSGSGSLLGLPDRFLNRPLASWELENGMNMETTITEVM